MQSRKRKNKPLLYQYYLQKENQLNNAITLAHSDSSNQICPSCNLNSMLYDTSTGETVCSNCGIVILERADVFSTFIAVLVVCRTTSGYLNQLELQTHLEILPKRFVILYIFVSFSYLSY
jgi:uncharacterized protein (DUF983 family)